MILFSKCSLGLVTSTQGKKNDWQKETSSNKSLASLFLPSLLSLCCLLVFSVNPIIYAYSSREFRRAFIKYLCRCFPMRIRNFMMSYHNLHLLRYRRPPESNVSKENIESGSDNHNHNHNNNNNNNTRNKPPMIVTSTSTTTSTVHSTMPHKHQPYQQLKTSKSKDTRKHSRIWFLSHCCRTAAVQRDDRPDKRSLSITSSRATVPTTILVDYCTYHDVAVSRVTCLW